MSVAGFDKGIKTVEDLQEAMSIYDYDRLYKEITALVNEGKLEPTKGGRDTNGRIPPLAKKYRIIPENPYNPDDYRREINRRFPLSFDRKYYKGHLAQYHTDRERILQMVAYHNQAGEPLAESMSINERLLDIYGNEKISKTYVFKVLRNLGLHEAWLNVYRTPEPFIYYAKDDEGPKNILIVENKDAWHTVRKLMMEGICPFTCVIFGEGKKILKSIEEIPYHQKTWFRHKDSTYAYFGDLDDEGAGIYMNLKKKAPFIEIDLWYEGYKMMYAIGEAKDLWRSFKVQTSLEPSVLEELFGFIGNEGVERIVTQFEKNFYIPQEAVNYQVLKVMWRK